jgi:hypothetical protein
MGLQKYRADQAGDKQSDGAIPFYAHWCGGPTLALLRDCPTEYGPRTVYVQGEPDTFFSIPAACSFRHKTVRGYITNSEHDYIFRAYKE